MAKAPAIDPDKLYQCWCSYVTKHPDVPGRDIYGKEGQQLLGSSAAVRAAPTHWVLAGTPDDVIHGLKTAHRLSAPTGGK